MNYYDKHLVVNEGEWFIMKSTPLPPKDEIEKVLSDIINNRLINVFNGRLYHSEMCNSEGHQIDSKIKKIIPNLSEETFKVAIFTNPKGVLEGQLLAIALEPQISFAIYPDHPHLNSSIHIGELGKYSPIRMPESLCYGYNKDEFGTNLESRLHKTFLRIAIWLLRHQVWVATRSMYGKGIWIGPQSDPFSDDVFPSVLNPNGLCRCGSKIKYLDCHLPDDFSKLHKCSIVEAKSILMQEKTHMAQTWEKFNYIPQQQVLNILNSNLL